VIVLRQTKGQAENRPGKHTLFEPTTQPEKLKKAHSIHLMTGGLLRLDNNQNKSAAIIEINFIIPKINKYTAANDKAKRNIFLKLILNY
jgi:hypothetical protein